MFAHPWGRSVLVTTCVVGKVKTGQQHSVGKSLNIANTTIIIAHEEESGGGSPPFHPVSYATAHKSPHNYHILYMSDFGSVGKFYFLSLFMKHIALWIYCVFHGNTQIAQCLQGLRAPSICFFVLLKARCCSC